MYWTLVGKIEWGTYKEFKSEPYDKLFEESKGWRKHKPPTTFDINKNEDDFAGNRQVLECFVNKKIVHYDFDYLNPKKYHIEKLTGGP